MPLSKPTSHLENGSVIARVAVAAWGSLDALDPDVAGLHLAGGGAGDGGSFELPPRSALRLVELAGLRSPRALDKGFIFFLRAGRAGAGASVEQGSQQAFTFSLGLPGHVVCYKTRPADVSVIGEGITDIQAQFPTRADLVDAASAFIIGLCHMLRQRSSWPRSKGDQLEKTDSHNVFMEATSRCRGGVHAIRPRGPRPMAGGKNNPPRRAA